VGVLDWLLPDASYSEQREGWTRRDYRPRHGKPPLAVRGWRAAAGIALTVQHRYLDLPEEESMARAPRTGPEPSLVLANNTYAADRPPAMKANNRSWISKASEIQGAK
jgi:hypothetical protein